MFVREEAAAGIAPVFVAQGRPRADADEFGRGVERALAWHDKAGMDKAVRVKAHFVVYPARHARRAPVEAFLSWIHGEAARTAQSMTQ